MHKQSSAYMNDDGAAHGDVTLLLLGSNKSVKNRQDVGNSGTSLFNLQYSHLLAQYMKSTEILVFISHPYCTIYQNVQHTHDFPILRAYFCLQSHLFRFRSKK